MAGFNLPQGLPGIRPQQPAVQGGPMPMNNMRPVGHMQVMNTSMPQPDMGNISSQMMRLWQLQQQQDRLGQRQQRLGNQVWQGQAQVDKSGGQVDDLHGKLMQLYGRQSPMDMTPDEPGEPNNEPDDYQLPMNDAWRQYLLEEEDDDDLPRYDYPRSYP